MAGNTFGQLFKVTTFGESHGPALATLAAQIACRRHRGGADDTPGNPVKNTYQDKMPRQPAKRIEKHTRSVAEKTDNQQKLITKFINEATEQDIGRGINDGIETDD